MATDMEAVTPLDKAREALAAVADLTAWRQDPRSPYYLLDEAGCVVVRCGCPYTRAAIVSAVNFVRADLPALIAEVERLANENARQKTGLIVAGAEVSVLADRVAKLEADRTTLLALLGTGEPTPEWWEPARALLAPAEGAEDGR